MMMIATSGFLAALECIKLVFGRTPDLLAGLRGTLLLRGREWRGEGTPPNANSWIRPWNS